MNLGGIEGLTKEDFVATVLHEFGHALGAEHEHQHPGSGCNDEWRWDDDAGYVWTTNVDGYLVEDQYGRWPGIYSMMSAMPDYWPRSKVDYNLRQLTDQSAYEFGEFDKYSIMKYYFRKDFYWQRDASPCYSDPPIQLSDRDKVQIGVFYPHGEETHEKAFKKAGEIRSALQELKKKFPHNSIVQQITEKYSE